MNVEKNIISWIASQCINNVYWMETHTKIATQRHIPRDIEVERCLKFLHTIWCTSIAIIRQQVFECYSRRVTETDFSIGKHYFGLNRLYMYVAYNINDLRRCTAHDMCCYWIFLIFNLVFWNPKFEEEEEKAVRMIQRTHFRFINYLNGLHLKRHKHTHNMQLAKWKRNRHTFQINVCESLRFTWYLVEPEKKTYR